TVLLRVYFLALGDYGSDLIARHRFASMRRSCSITAAFVSSLPGGLTLALAAAAFQSVSSISRARSAVMYAARSTSTSASTLSLRLFASHGLVLAAALIP